MKSSYQPEYKEYKKNTPNITGLRSARTADDEIVQDYTTENMRFSNGTTLAICEVRGHRDTQEDAVAFDAAEDSARFSTQSHPQQTAIMKTMFANLQTRFEKTNTGSCACVATGWIENNKASISTSYVGDSVAFLIVIAADGSLKHAQACNPELHDCYNTKEVTDIKEGIGRKEGGVFLGRLGGILAVTRAFGDAEANDYGISHEPQTVKHEFTGIVPDDHVYMVVTCDGVMEHHKGVNVATDCANEFGKLFSAMITSQPGITPAELSEAIVSNAYTNGVKASNDNNTAMVFELSSNGPATGAVFDGHGGAEVAIELSKDFNKEFTRALNTAPTVKPTATLQKLDDVNPRKINTPPAALFSTNGENTSYVAGISGYDRNNDQHRRKLATQRAAIYNKIAAANSRGQNPNAGKVVVEYDPTIFTSDQDLRQSLHTDATADHAGKAAAWRHRTKHRAVTSIVTCFGNGFGEELETPFNMIVTTGCAPNFMTSEQDKTHYIRDGRLKLESYQATMKLSFKRWLSAQDKSKVTAVIIPFIGGGVYLKKLNKEDKIAAKTAIMTALKEALEESTFDNIKEVIFSLPLEDGKKTKDFNDAVSVFKNYRNHAINLTVASTDVFDTAHHLHQQGISAGLINPGSDRTIGGGYLTTIDGIPRDTMTLEEVISNLTDLVFVQAADQNENNMRFIPYPPELHNSAQQESRKNAPDKSRGSPPMKSSHQLKSGKLAILQKRTDFNPLHAKESGQAARIYAGLKAELLANPQLKIGLLYAANNAQALKLHTANQATAGTKIPMIDGSGQAQLFAELIKLINADNMQDKIHILPIATSMHGGDNKGDNKVSTELINRDLRAIAEHLENGFKVYGMPRRERGLEKEYAIGGGASKEWMELTIPQLGNLTQNDYLQKHLASIENECLKDKPDYSFIPREQQRVATKQTLPTVKPTASAAAVPASGLTGSDNKATKTQTASTLTMLSTVPLFIAKFEHDEQEYEIAITDHEPIVMKTAVGKLASLNIWCPGSPIAPTTNPTNPRIDKAKLTHASQRKQMQLMAKYLFDMAAEEGVVGFMLQEVPVPTGQNYKLLNAELGKLCANHNKLYPAQKISLALNNWHMTAGTQSGTCSLVNTHKLNVTDLTPDLKTSAMTGRFGCYEVEDKTNPKLKFTIANIHGDGNHMQQRTTADFVSASIHDNIMTCGDLNITAGSEEARFLQKHYPSDNHHKMYKGRLNTLDCFFDPYTPRLVKKAAKEAVKVPKAADAATKDTATTLPFVMINGQKAAVINNPKQQPYGALSNTTKAGDYPVTQTVQCKFNAGEGETHYFNWPSSEHAFHAQKLIHFMRQHVLDKNDPRKRVLLTALRQLQATKAKPGEVFSRREDFHPLIDQIISANPTLNLGGSYKGFHNACDYPTQFDNFMYLALELKIHQTPSLTKLVMQMAREGIMPIKSSQDDTWSSGKDGTGKNLLGIMILIIGNRLLKGAGEEHHIVIDDPLTAYKTMQEQGAAALSHDALANEEDKPAKKHRTTHALVRDATGAQQNEKKAASIALPPPPPEALLQQAANMRSHAAKTTQKSQHRAASADMNTAMYPPPPPPEMLQQPKQAEQSHTHHRVKKALAANPVTTAAPAQRPSISVNDTPPARQPQAAAMDISKEQAERINASFARIRQLQVEIDAKMEIALQNLRKLPSASGRPK